MFITAIAKEKKMEKAEVLAVLIPHISIFAHVGEAILTCSLFEPSFRIPMVELRIPEMYLHVILSKGAWEGHRIRGQSVDVETGQDRIDEARFGEAISLKVEDLFVYGPDLAYLESQHPEIFKKPSTSPQIEAAPSPRVERNLYALVGVLVDMLVDGKGKGGNVLPLPERANYVFKSQALVAHIDEKYEVHGHGLKHSTLEKIFGLANSTLREKMSR